MFICFKCVKKLKIGKLAFFHDGPPEKCIAYNECGNQAAFWIGYIEGDEYEEPRRRWEEFYEKHCKK